MIEADVERDQEVVYEIKWSDRELTVLEFLYPDKQKVQREGDNLPRSKPHLSPVEIHFHKVRHFDELKAVHAQPIPKLNQRAQKHVNVCVEDALCLNESVFKLMIVSGDVSHVIEVLIPVNRNADKRNCCEKTYNGDGE